MTRLTVDTNMSFCDIAQCSSTPGGSFCEDGYCDQRRCYERLREYERIGTVEKFRAALRRTAEHDKAVEEGRLVELPCKVGDAVYLTTRGYVEETKVRTFFVGHPSYNRGEPDPRYEMIRLTNFDVPLKCFGKTVFLTRQEAEAALEGCK